MDPNDRVDLSSVNKTKKQLKLPQFKNPFKKNSAGPGRDAEGKFTSGSGGLLNNKKFDLKRAIPVVAVVALVGGFLVFRSFAGTALLGNDGEYVPVAPARLYDTRTVGTKTPVGAGKTITIPVAGKAGVPAGAKAVVAYVSAVGPAANGYTRVGASDQALTATQQNYSKGQSITNQVTIPVSAAGSIKLMSSAQSHFVLDVHGYISSQEGADGLRYASVQSARAYDTRSSGTKQPVAAGKTVTFDIAGKAGIPPEARAVSINLSAVGPVANGYARMWPGGATSSPITILNYTKGQSITGQVTVPLDGSGKLTLFTSAQSHFTFDMTGYYEPEGYIGTSTSQNGRFVPIAGKRVLDTRTQGGIVGKATEREFYISMRNVDPNADEYDMPVISVTAVGPGGNGYARVGTKDNISATQLNYTKGQSITNQFAMSQGSNLGSYKLWTSQQSHFVVDVVGYVKTVSSGVNGYIATQIYEKDAYQGSFYNKISYTSTIVRNQTESGYGRSTTSVGFDLSSIPSPTEYPHTLPGWNWPLVQTENYNSSPIGSHGSTAKSNFISYQCVPAESCKVSHPSAKTQDGTATYSGGVVKTTKDVNIPIIGTNGGEYRFIRELQTDQPGLPGVWEVISVAYNGKTEELIRHQVVEPGANLKFGYRANIHFSLQDNQATQSCNSLMLQSLEISNMSANDKNINAQAYDPYGFDSIGTSVANGDCPGISKASFKEGKLTHKFGIAKQERDIVAPVIVSTEEVRRGQWYDNSRGLKVSVSDNADVARIECISSAFGCGGSWSEGSTPVFNKSATRLLSLNDYDDTTPERNEQVTIKVFDTSGNVAEKTLTVTLE